MSIPTTESSTSSNIISINTEINVSLPQKSDIIHSLREILNYNATHSVYTEKYNLSTESVQLIQIVLNDSPKFFIDIAKAFTEIVEDSKFDTHDIPNVIKVIKNVVLLNTQLFIANGIMNSVSIAQFIRTLFILLIESQYVWIPHNTQAAIIRNIDASIDLLVSNLFVKSEKVKSCWSACNKFFRIC